MAKSLLILMLMTTQLLSGTCGSLHLCISSDGSFCCIDAGPESCTCCHGHDDASHEACLEEAESEDCCEHCEQLAIQSDAQGLVATDGCGCVHIPLMVTSSQPTTVARDTTRESVERYFLLVALLPSLLNGSGQYVAFSPHHSWFEPSVVPDFALIVISTVVIRC